MCDRAMPGRAFDVSMLLYVVLKISYVSSARPYNNYIQFATTLCVPVSAM